MARACRVLLIFPRFNPHSFWSYDLACEVLGAGYPAAPLSLITVAALLPKTWELRLVNRNTEELGEADLSWADMVMTGGMLAQQRDTLEVIRMCRERGTPVVVGGPDATSSPHVYAEANFRLLGEVEDIIHDFVVAWDRGERNGFFEAAKFQVDVTKTPVPRFDLLKLEQYLYVGVQFSRGCPFTCEFCDIIELYGRTPRTKTPAQMLAELQALYDFGYRGHVDFVDDNFIGNKKAVKAFLPHLIEWQKARRYPFMFTTEASINAADDVQLLTLMREANFFGFFVGIETPDAATLVHTQKKQNTRRDLVTSVQRIYDAGLFVVAGFVIGFDTEKKGLDKTMVQCIEDASIPVAMLSLLYALPNTQLTRRLEKEGRLHPNHDRDISGNAGELCLAGLNFETLRPRRDIYADYKAVLDQVYDRDAFFARTRRMVMGLNRIDLGAAVHFREAFQEIGRFFRFATHVTFKRPDMRWPVWRLLAECMVRNPRAVRHAVAICVFYLYLKPLTQYVSTEIGKRIEELDRAEAEAAARPSVAAAAPGDLAVA